MHPHRPSIRFAKRVCKRGSTRWLTEVGERGLITCAGAVCVPCWRGRPVARWAALGAQGGCGGQARAVSTPLRAAVPFRRTRAPHCCPGRLGGSGSGGGSGSRMRPVAGDPEHGYRQERSPLRRSGRLCGGNRATLAASPRRRDGNRRGTRRPTESPGPMRASPLAHVCFERPQQLLQPRSGLQQPSRRRSRLSCFDAATTRLSL